ncbi:restriction endonuclease subunit S [Nonomuraea basaltis]|uniref:restriction endonuclease subunit S n=1 Tax=Nonomuraea basaltis TaxID=2495887 RepID=UPI0019817A69|nr:restriction endonuclease subunit S [Nonomuraea basaltis]
MSTPSTWMRTRVDRVATVNARIGWKALTASEYQPGGYVFLATPNIKSESIDFENVNYISEYRYEESPELKLKVGDVLLAKDGNTLGITNVVRDLPRPTTVNGSIAVLRAFDIEPRFLRYSLASSATQDVIDAIKGGMGVPHLFQWDIKRLPLALPPLEEQRRIADFLDAETARIDRLAAAQQSVVSLIQERRRRVLDDVLIPLRLRQESPASWRPLGYLTEYSRPIMYGIVLPGPNVEDGVPIVKGGDVAAGRLSLARLNKTTREIEASYVRSRLRAGDLVIAIRGSVGEVAMVPEEVAGANLTQDAARIAPGPDVHGRWLELILQTPTLEAQIRSRITGATVKGINIWDLRRVSVPQVNFEDQLRAVKQADVTLAVMSDLTSATEHQLILLAERRQALITAAVTGQIDVTTARRVPPSEGASV